MKIPNSIIASFAVSGGKKKMKFSQEFVEKLGNILFSGDERKC